MDHKPRYAVGLDLYELESMAGCRLTMKRADPDYTWVTPPWVARRHAPKHRAGQWLPWADLLIASAPVSPVVSQGTGTVICAFEGALGVRMLWHMALRLGWLCGRRRGMVRKPSSTLINEGVF